MKFKKVEGLIQNFKKFEFCPILILFLFLLYYFTLHKNEKLIYFRNYK